MSRFFTSFLADGQYDATVLEEILKKAFGTGPLFGSAHLRPSGMKLAVTATTISDATLYLFTNYNGNRAEADDPEGFSKIPRSDVLCLASNILQDASTFVFHGLVTKSFFGKRRLQVSPEYYRD